MCTTNFLLRYGVLIYFGTLLPPMMPQRKLNFPNVAKWNPPKLVCHKMYPPMQILLHYDLLLIYDVLIHSGSFYPLLPWWCNKVNQNFWNFQNEFHQWLCPLKMYPPCYFYLSMAFCYQVMVFSPSLVGSI